MSNKFIGLDGKADGLGVLNGFRLLTDRYVRQVVQEGNWFTLCHKIDEKQLDIMKLSNGSETMGQILSHTYENSNYRTAIYKYLLTGFLCYVEVPTVKYKSDIGVRSSAFNKMLVTANMSVVAEWLGITYEEAKMKYSARVMDLDYDEETEEVPYLKLTEDLKTGTRKVTVPRKDLDIGQKGTRVVPLFMLKAGVDELYNILKEDIVKVTFLKDNSQVRDIFTTLNFQKVRDIYGTGNYLDDSIMTSYNGEFLENKTMARGYIRVPEIGGSKYDSPTRSINFARIISIDYEEKPDLSYINYDLSTVIDSFTDCVLMHKNQSEDIIEMIDAFDMDRGYWNGKTPKYSSKDVSTLVTWVESENMLLSTVFLRKLCLFMLANPVWFSSFDGQPKSFSTSSNGDVGLA